ncbi:SDR family oxidoreductase [Telmatocola sphagniphila]|uniref:SDR family oxidoreductase n=1 Tax=Telmatocola sphagniphila TaxID=1123043 RepID=A0A8E6B8M3_9BACT|nr:SDR family oxidoreductase [Telmatocola sphagniphila]QVL33479.1 SDR family oxidoreductase [Telmatocola sphagniphila]
MPQQRGVLLTGATGFLGQYLVKDLLQRMGTTTVLVRNSKQANGFERISEIVELWEERLQKKLSKPFIICGDLSDLKSSLSKADKNWIQKNCSSVLHCAANLSFRKTPEQEPFKTNLNGTRALLDLCESLSVSNWHHISTAFVSGRRSGTILEQEATGESGFHNPYEESKFLAEVAVRNAKKIHSTIYRPSIIVGDSETGYTTTYTGLYRFLELAVRLARSIPQKTLATSTLRIPFDGNEEWNLIPVDWVARTILKLFNRSSSGGKIFHLVSDSPIKTSFIRDIGVETLRLTNIELAKIPAKNIFSRLDELFRQGVQEYWPYISGNPLFSMENLLAELPDARPPRIDRTVLERLIRFADNDHWGKKSSGKPGYSGTINSESACAVYIEKTFPILARRSDLAREAKLDVTVTITLTGKGGGCWTCKWEKGELIFTRPGIPESATVKYISDTQTFAAIISGRQSPQEAFFEQKIAIKGDVESGLKLAYLFGQFITETPVGTSTPKEVADVLSSQD